MRRAACHGTNEQRCVDGPPKTARRNIDHCKITFRKGAMFQPYPVEPGIHLAQRQVARRKRKMRVLSITRFWFSHGRLGSCPV